MATIARRGISAATKADEKLRQHGFCILRDVESRSRIEEIDRSLHPGHFMRLVENDDAAEILTHPFDQLAQPRAPVAAVGAQGGIGQEEDPIAQRDRGSGSRSTSSRPLAVRWGRAFLSMAAAAAPRSP